MNIRKGFAPILIIILIGLALLGGYFIYQNQTKTTQKACTLDAKICPDGTTVSRVGANCEFTTCPSPSPDETANWKTYTNDKLKFTFRYPDIYRFEKQDNEKVTFSGTFEPGDQIIPSELTVHFNRITNTDSLKNCEDIDYENLKDDIEYRCIDGEVIIKVFNEVEMRLFGLIYGTKNSQAANDYIAQTVNGPRVEFVHHVLGGGVPTRMDKILSTFKFLP